MRERGRRRERERARERGRVRERGSSKTRPSPLCGPLCCSNLFAIRCTGMWLGMACLRAVRVPSASTSTPPGPGPSGHSHNKSTWRVPQHTQIEHTYVTRPVQCSAVRCRKGRVHRKVPGAGAGHRALHSITRGTHHTAATA
jgi:hypothetical protein